MIDSAWASHGGAGIQPCHCTRYDRSSSSPPSPARADWQAGPRRTLLQHGNGRLTLADDVARRAALAGRAQPVASRTGTSCASPTARTSPGDVMVWRWGKGIGDPATAGWLGPPPTGTITLVSSLIPARFDLEPGVARWVCAVCQADPVRVVCRSTGHAIGAESLWCDWTHDRLVPGRLPDLQRTTRPTAARHRGPCHPVKYRCLRLAPKAEWQCPGRRSLSLSYRH